MTERFIEQGPEEGEKISQIMEALQRSGPEDSNYQKLMGEWLDRRETMIDQEKGGVGKSRLITYKEMATGHIYLSAGYEKEGFKTLSAAEASARAIMKHDEEGGKILLDEVLNYVASVMASFPEGKRAEMEALRIEAEREFEDERHFSE